MHLDHTRVKNTIIIIPFQIKLFGFSNEVAATVKLDFNTLLQPSSFYLPAHSTVDVMSRHLAKIHLWACASSLIATRLSFVENTLKNTVK